MASKLFQEAEKEVEEILKQINIQKELGLLEANGAYMSGLYIGTTKILNLIKKYEAEEVCSY